MESLPQIVVAHEALSVTVWWWLIGARLHDLDLVLASGDPLKDGLLELGKRTETFRFKDIPSRPVPSLLRGFSAPVNLSIDHSEADLQFLMANDSDLYNRWQAAQEYATRVIVAAVKAVRAEKTPERPDAFIAALGVTVANHDLDPGYRAQFMPS